MIGRAPFATSIAIAMAGYLLAAPAFGGDNGGALAAAEHCAHCHAMPGEADAGLAPALDEISTKQRVWTDTDLRTALPRLHGTRASITLNGEEARAIGQYLQNIQSGHPEVFP